MAAFENGWLPGVMLSELELSGEPSSAFELMAETFLAIGASGRAGCTFSTFTAGVGASDEATAGVGLEALEEFGKAVTQQTSAIAAKTMKHPLRSQKKTCSVRCNHDYSTVLRNRGHWPNGHIFCWYLYCPLTLPESWDFSTKLVQRSQYVRETPAILPRN